MARAGGLRSQDGDGGDDLCDNAGNAVDGMDRASRDCGKRNRPERRGTGRLRSINAFAFSCPLDERRMSGFEMVNT